MVHPSDDSAGGTLGRWRLLDAATGWSLATLPFQTSWLALVVEEIYLDDSVKGVPYTMTCPPRLTVPRHLHDFRSDAAAFGRESARHEIRTFMITRSAGAVFAVVQYSGPTRVGETTACFGAESRSVADADAVLVVGAAFVFVADVTRSGPQCERWRRASPQSEEIDEEYSGGRRSRRA